MAACGLRKAVLFRSLWRSVQGKRSACWVMSPSRHESIGGENTQRAGGRGGGGAGGIVWAAIGFSLFGSTDEERRDEAQRKEEEIILLLKNAKMANLAYVQGHLDHDDNAVIEMSLKLATIYAEQSKVELAEHGFRFCMESLQEKLQRDEEAEPTEEQQQQRKDSRLLLGLCFDSRARYRASRLQLGGAERDYREALQICGGEQGDTHPQTLVLMSDLATVLDLQGRHDDALLLVQHAVELSRSVGHPDLQVLLGNMAGILLHTGRLEDAVRFYQEALILALQAKDKEAVNAIQEGLKEVKKKEEEQKKKKNKEEGD
ncbi:tetratricopeptide repeat protein 19, mitochondrial isoform X4 [Eleginops maclovinus]|uniref:tetratricopeptide repeat protein 19, mitochondrial isoform X4 n=1 Tax=Eleginops maclovinus TaxID=56733 RepID=UPI003080C4F1